MVNCVARCLLSALLLAPALAVADCRLTTAAVASMDTARLHLVGPNARSMQLVVRVADDRRERAGGFQYLCPEVIEGTAIYFVFKRQRRPSFHMHNVKAPLDIAFIDGNGAIIDIQRMQPYAPSAQNYVYYSPPGPVAAALETRAGFFAANGMSERRWRITQVEP